VRFRLSRSDGWFLVGLVGILVVVVLVVGGVQRWEASIDEGNEIVSLGVSHFSGIHVSVPTDVATATPGLMVDCAGVGNCFEIRDGGTPVAQWGDGGAFTGSGARTFSGLVNANGGIAVDTSAFTVADATGNTVVSGTLAVSGTSTLAGLANADGGIAVDTSAFTVADATGNTVVSGTLTVSGTSTLAGLANADGGIAVDTSAFTVADATGNTVVSGTLTVSGTSTLAGAVNADGGIAVDTSAFTVADATGNTVVSGTLTVSGTSTLAGLANADGGIAVDTSAFTVADATGNTVVSGTLAVSDTSTLAGGLTVSAGGLDVAGGVFEMSHTEITNSYDLTPTSTLYIVNSTGATVITPTACSNLGQMLFFYGDDNNGVTIAKANLLTTDGNDVAIDQYDLVGFMCVTTKWALMFEANLQ